MRWFIHRRGHGKVPYLRKTARVTRGGGECGGLSTAEGTGKCPICDKPRE